MSPTTPNSEVKITQFLNKHKMIFQSSFFSLLYILKTGRICVSETKQGVSEVLLRRRASMVKLKNWFLRFPGFYHKKNIRNRVPSLWKKGLIIFFMLPDSRLQPVKKIHVVANVDCMHCDLSKIRKISLKFRIKLRLT
jgi:hypothetical protein